MERKGKQVDNDYDEVTDELRSTTWVEYADRRMSVKYRIETNPNQKAIHERERQSDDFVVVAPLSSQDFSVLLVFAHSSEGILQKKVSNCKNFIIEIEL